MLRGAHKLFAFKAALQAHLCDVLWRKHIIVNAKRAFERIARGIEDVIALAFARFAPRSFAVAAHVVQWLCNEIHARAIAVCRVGLD